jgi:hypothetical protein
MPLSIPPVEAYPHVQLDWLELKILRSEYKTEGLAGLKRDFDTRRNSEGRDPEGGTDDEEAFFERLLEEMRFRSDSLGDAYPFRLSESGESLELVDAITPGGYIYLFCLFLSHPSAGQVFSGEYLPEIDNSIRNLFQACSTLAAAGEIGGTAYSFGYPRPDGSNFLTKLHEVYRAFGEGQVVAEIPAGASTWPKDEEIDIICWRPSSDGAAGKPYMLGQVASGANWGAKSIKGGSIESFHNVWFIRRPASEAKASMFFPFCIDPTASETLRERLEVLVHKYGTIIYRYRLPRLAQIGIDLKAENADLVVEGELALPTISEWVDAQISQFEAVGR